MMILIANIFLQILYSMEISTWHWRIHFVVKYIKIISTYAVSTWCYNIHVNSLNITVLGIPLSGFKNKPTLFFSRLKCLLSPFGE